jgi:glucose/arabinose dehydrogenase
MRASLLTALTGTLLLGAGCLGTVNDQPGDDSGDDTGALTTELFASGFNAPVYVTYAPGLPDWIFIVERGSGTAASIQALNLTSGQRQTFLVLSGLSTGGERGLLGLAFHPDFMNNRECFVNYTDLAGDTIVARISATTVNPPVASASSQQTVLKIQQPFANHNGGWIAFGPDGYLYIATGDGGSANDPNNRAQTREDVLLGKLLRINVDEDAFPNDPLRNYAIPPDNPFVNEPRVAKEIWAFGLRNPWRNAFDSATGDLYIADVGQSTAEELNFQPADSTGGENYGWRCMEGRACTGLTGCTCNSPDLTLPIHDYAHENSRCSITGGEVYRGASIPELAGTYFFADFCSGDIWSARVVDGNLVDLENRTSELAPPGDAAIDAIVSFGRDADGELYICDFADGEIYRIIKR